jgi:hypothetical protein
MKNNSDPALLRTSYLSYETIKRTLNFNDTLPLNFHFNLRMIFFTFLKRWLEVIRFKTAQNFNTHLF